MQQEQGEKEFYSQISCFSVFTSPGPWALQQRLSTAYYYRSKQLAFAELQHLTLEPLLFATLYKYLWKLDKEIFWQLLLESGLLKRESLLSKAGPPVGC